MRLEPALAAPLADRRTDSGEHPMRAFRRRPCRGDLRRAKAEPESDSVWVTELFRVAHVTCRESGARKWIDLRETEGDRVARVRLTLELPKRAHAAWKAPGYGFDAEDPFAERPRDRVEWMRRQRHSDRTQEQVHGLQPFVDVTRTEELFGGPKLVTPSLAGQGEPGRLKIRRRSVARAAGVRQCFRMSVRQFGARSVSFGAEF